MPLHEVGSYRIFMVHRAQANQFQNQINLYDTDDSQFAVLQFTAGTVPVPQVSSGGTYFLYFPLEQYEKTIDLLRNEKPVYFWWGGETSLNYLRSGNETVGEGELPA